MERVPSRIFLVIGESRHHGIKYNNHFDLCASKNMNEDDNRTIENIKMSSSDGGKQKPLSILKFISSSISF